MYATRYNQHPCRFISRSGNTEQGFIQRTQTDEHGDEVAEITYGRKGCHTISLPVSDVTLIDAFPAADVDDEAREDNRATYCPEDNKLRLYLGERLTREGYLYLSSRKFSTTPKQNCDFVATWSPQAENLVFELLPDGADIEDEDYSPQERAADRAERFEGYLSKRRAEAHEHADTSESAPDVVGFQSIRKARSAARRIDGSRKAALSSWAKAEYWQERTEAVRAAALYKSSNRCRQNRLKELEKSHRDTIETLKRHDAEISAWRAITNAETDSAARELFDAKKWYSRAKLPHPRADFFGWPEELADHPDGVDVRTVATIAAEHLEAVPARERCQRWVEHYSRRIDYEKAMLGINGGTCGELDIVPGGFIGSHQVYKVNRSRQSGRVVSVSIRGSWGFISVNGNRVYCGHQDANGLAKVEVEGLNASHYRPPTAEELEQFEADKKAASKAKRKATPDGKKSPSILNPSPEDAARLVAMLDRKSTSRNQSGALKSDQVGKVRDIKGEHWKQLSKIDVCNIYTITRSGRVLLYRPEVKRATESGSAVFRVRLCQRGFHDLYDVHTMRDKKQHPLPWDLIDEQCEASKGEDLRLVAKSNQAESEADGNEPTEATPPTAENSPTFEPSSCEPSETISADSAAVAVAEPETVTSVATLPDGVTMWPNGLGFELKRDGEWFEVFYASGRCEAWALNSAGERIAFHAFIGQMRNLPNAAEVISRHWQTARHVWTHNDDGSRIVIADVGTQPKQAEAEPQPQPEPATTTAATVETIKRTTTGTDGGLLSLFD